MGGCGPGTGEGGGGGGPGSGTGRGGGSGWGTGSGNGGAGSGGAGGYTNEGWCANTARSAPWVGITRAGAVALCAEQPTEKPTQPTTRGLVSVLAGRQLWS